MAKKIYRFDDIIGQTINKSIIINQLLGKKLSQFIFLYGDSGSGKSTMAELIAMSATCQHDDINPCMQCPRCLDNLEALQSTGVSRNIKKINIGKLISKDDVKKMIHEIFDLQPIPGEKTFYILEEVHLLGKNQDMLLEELERIPEDTHVIMCTTNYNDILDTLKTRATLKLHFKRLTPSECSILINKLINSYEVKGFKNSDRVFLANAANCNAREITNFIETFKDDDNLSTIMRNYFSSIPIPIYFSLVEALLKDFPNFIIYLNDLESSNNLVDVWSGFHSFVRDAIFYLYGGGATLFTNQEKSSIKTIFSQLSDERISKLYRLSHKPAKTQMEAEYNLINLREFLVNTGSSPKAEIALENNMATRNAIIESNKSSKEKLEVKKLDIQSLNNLSTSNFVYDVTANFGGV